MSSVYVVMYGAYAVDGIAAVFSDEEAAKSFCETKNEEYNEGKEERINYYDFYEYEVQ